MIPIPKESLPLRQGRKAKEYFVDGQRYTVYDLLDHPKNTHRIQVGTIRRRLLEENNPTLARIFRPLRTP